MPAPKTAGLRCRDYSHRLLLGLLQCWLLAPFDTTALGAGYSYWRQYVILKVHSTLLGFVAGLKVYINATCFSKVARL